VIGGVLGRKSYHRYLEVRTKLLSKASLLSTRLALDPN
jgi:hypothetical protein